jgi:hypothetical protein
MILQDLTKIEQDLAMILPKILRDLAVILQYLTKIQQDLAMTPQDFYQVCGKNTWQIQNEEALHEIYYTLGITLIELFIYYTLGINFDSIIQTNVKVCNIAINSVSVFIKL